MSARRQQLEEQIITLRRTLHLERMKKARYGPTDVPAKVLLDIEDIEDELTLLQEELAALSPDGSTPSLPASTPESALSTPHNPFVFGGAVPPEMFYGRQALVQAIVQRVGGSTAQSISIVGERRMGKSSLLRYLQVRAGHLFAAERRPLLIYLDLTRGFARTRRGLMRYLRRELGRAWQEPWDKTEDGDLAAFDFALEDLQADGIRLILCLDEVENLTQRAAEFNDVLEDWRACGSLGQLAMVTASARPLADLCLSGGLTSPFYNIFEQRWLGLLAPDAWQALVRDQMPVSDEELTVIDEVAGGQPFFTQLAASYLWQSRSNPLPGQQQWTAAAKAQIEPHLRHLWTKLALPEQAALRRLATHNSPLPPDSHRLAALERRGLLRNGRPFSALFAEFIKTTQ